MLHAKTPRTRTTPTETLEASEIEDISIAPIGIPIIAGPGAITSVMLLSHQVHLDCFLQKYTQNANIQHEQ